MAIKSKSGVRKRKIEIDLTGPNGNAYVLLAYAKEFSDQLDLDYEAIKRDMISSDYEHLIKVFDREFGCLVTLYR